MQGGLSNPVGDPEDGYRLKVNGETLVKEIDRPDFGYYTSIHFGDNPLCPKEPNPDPQGTPCSTDEIYLQFLIKLDYYGYVC